MKCYTQLPLMKAMPELDLTVCATAPAINSLYFKFKLQIKGSIWLMLPLVLYEHLWEMPLTAASFPTAISLSVVFGIRTSLNWSLIELSEEDKARLKLDLLGTNFNLLFLVLCSCIICTQLLELSYSIIQTASTMCHTPQQLSDFPGLDHLLLTLH